MHIPGPNHRKPQTVNKAEPVESSQNIIKHSVEKTSNGIPHISLMRIPISFSSVKASALIDIGAGASFLAYKIVTKIPP